jgi:hypothetical protein
LKDRKRLTAPIVALVASSVALAAVCPPALAAHWSTRELPTPTPSGESAREYFAAASCPSASVCVAIGNRNLVASSPNPTGDVGAWGIVQPVEDERCEDNRKRCESGGEISGGTPGGPPIALLQPWQSRKVTDVSCPTVDFCAATTHQGFVYTTHNPLGSAGAWKVTDLDGEGPNTHLKSISCTDPSFCVAVSAYSNTGGRILSSANPDGGAAAWQEADLSPGENGLDLRAVSCGTRDYCIAVDHEGQMVRSANPLGPASSWVSLGTPGGPGSLNSIECVGIALCVAGNASGNLISTGDPADPHPEWHEVSGGGSVPVTDVSCPDAAHCLAVDNNGDTITSTDPTGGPGSWVRENQIPYVERDQYELPTAPNAIFGVSCPTTSLCVLGATERRILTSTDPFAAPPSAGKRKKRHRPPKRPRTFLAHVDRLHIFTRHHSLRMTFRFFTRTKSRGFRCRQDGGPWYRCKSPHRFRAAIGHHAFRVRAIGPTGLEGPIAGAHFRVVSNRACRRRHC